MQVKHSLKTAFTALKVNRLRSALTILGIVIGVTAIIIIMSVGEGANQLILAQVQGLGSRTMFLVPGKDTQGPGMSALFVDSLKERELNAITNKTNVPTLLDAAPGVSVPGVLSYQGDTFQATTMGSSPLLLEILDIYPEDGAPFTDYDVRQKGSVVLIGNNVKEKLFGESSALNQKISIKGKPFRVIGVFPEKGRVGLLNVDDLALIPYSTAQEYLVGKKHYDEIFARAESESTVERTKRDIALTLRELHGITDPDKDDFHIHTQADIAERVSVITGVMTSLLLSVAAISLVVGGIGIMNIMLVSVTERTREIGLRKALGATNRDILTQFLLESVGLTLVGGILGIALGAVISFAASVALTRFAKLDWTFTIPLWAAIVGVIVSTAIGVIFGIYPARRASRKSPIEALRYE
ncbi:MAG: ABC transporter permease [Candidatus Jacksonbacteria bacterium]|nr:ABC transporter permease [Candidatus Jacksonbacteria bacterium]